MLFGFSRHCTRSDLVPRRNPYTAMPVPHFTKNYSNNDKRHQTFKVFIEQNNKPIKKILLGLFDDGGNQIWPEFQLICPQMQCVGNQSVTSYEGLEFVLNAL